MSWWNPVNWFAVNEAPPPTITDASDAIELAMDSLDALHSKRMHLLKRSADFLKEAKDHKKNGDSTRAMACMKRKQQVDTLARQIEGQLLNLEKTSMVMESTATTVDLARTMKVGSDTIKSLLQDISVDEIEQVADDLNENMTDAHDLGEALSRPLGVMEDPDQDETILAEMAEWDAERVIAKLPNINTSDGSVVVAEEPEKPVREKTEVVES